MRDVNSVLAAPTGRRLWASAVALVLAIGLSAAGKAQTTPPASTAPTSPPAAAPVQAAPTQADIDLVKYLRAGGHAIVMRHAPADPDKFDADPRNFKNVRTQQPLSDGGQLAARAFGEALRVIGVPIGEVLTSRFNRAYQTAVLAGFKDAKPVTELTEGSLVTSPNEQRRRSSALKQLAAAPLLPGMNRLLITHRLNIMYSFGKEWFEVKEGEASIFRVDNGAYSLVARLQLGDWQRLTAVKR
jgi:phosphohistidine phosphatase SixA